MYRYFQNLMSINANKERVIFNIICYNIIIEDSVRRLEKEIMALEEKQNEVNEQLADPQSYGDPEKAKELNEKAASIARQLKERNYEWEIETEKLLELDKDY